MFRPRESERERKVRIFFVFAVYSLIFFACRLIIFTFACCELALTLNTIVDFVNLSQKVTFRLDGLKLFQALWFQVGDMSIMSSCNVFMPQS